MNNFQTKFICKSEIDFEINGFNSRHGYLNILSDTSIIVTKNKLIEVVLRGGNGGSGGGAGSINCCDCTPGITWSGGLGGKGSGIRFLLNVQRGDTLYFKRGNNGSDGCDRCVPTNICNCCYEGTSGVSGSSSLVSINSPSLNNYLFKASGGEAGTAGLYKGTGGVGINGTDGLLITGDQYNNNGAFILDSNIGGLGAAIILRW